MSVLHSTHRARDEHLLYRDVRPEQIRLKLALRINVTTISIFAGNLPSAITVLRLFFSFHKITENNILHNLIFPSTAFGIKRRVN